MKQENMIYIVGNKFKAFTKNAGVYTFSDFIKTVCNSNGLIENSTLCLGQGLNDEEIDIIKSLAIHKNGGYITKAFLKRASKEITHKHKEKNILISDPIVLNKDKAYSAELYIDDDCDEMNDHLTGQHVQGMVLIEAARQMMIAVAEKYILKENEKNNLYCALLSMSSKFHQFVFPIETTIVHKMGGFMARANGVYSGCTETEFYQNGKLVSSISITSIFSNNKYMTEKEASLALSTIETHKEFASQEYFLEQSA